MRMYSRAFCLLIIMTASALTTVQGQQTEVFRSELKPYYDAVELMKFGRYEPARKGFDDFIARNSDEPSSEFYVNAAYYRASTAMTLFHKDAKFLMEEFVLKYPESIWLRPAMLELARYNFNRRDYKDALQWFNRLDVRDFDPITRDEIVFKKGFSAFELKDFETARAAFYKLKDQEGAYYGPTNYYYGHIAYTEGNYQTALESFKKAETDENFAPVVPYYVAQIYHFQHKYDELIEYAGPLWDNPDTKRKDEIARLLGNAYFQKENYAAAIPYLEAYMTRNYNPLPDDAYMLAYAYYRTGEFAKSIDYFAKATKAEGELAQIATYQMADAYVELGEKQYAQNAFKVAAQMDFDREVTEDALFNYAKLAYELSYDPFHEAITAFEDYLKKYPESGRRDEAYEFLLKVYLVTKNYPAALSALDKIDRLNAIQRGQYQRAAYNMAVEEMNQGRNESAIKYLQLSKKYPEDSKTNALTDYMLGDLNYRLSNYDEGVAAYRRFLDNPAAYQTPYFNTANYNIGYSYFKEGQYDQSLTAFRKFVSSANVDARRKNDAYLRIGDLNLVMKNYDRAIESYGAADGKNAANADYAMFQTAMAYGYRDDYAKKIQTLQTLFNEHPETSLAALARYELGESYFLVDKLPQALAAFNTVIVDFSQSPYRKKALLKRGLVQYRMGAYDDAIASYKTVVKDYGVDSESHEAIATLKNIYLDLGRVDDFSDWLATIPDYKVSPGELDSLSYQAAENLVAANNCDAAIPALEKYLANHAGGLFVTNAEYYLADCAYRKNDFDRALKGFEYVVSQPTGQFTESALLGAADILYHQEDYEKALKRYRRLEQVASFPTNILEAKIGQMRIDYRLGNYEEALTMANAVIDDSNTPDDIRKEARLSRARIRFTMKDYDAAKPDYTWLAENARSKEGAESQYRLAQIAYLQGDGKKAENTVFDLIQKFGGYDYWKIKGFLLLSDIYIDREDYFQARTTLNQVIANVTDSALVREAQLKLDAVDNVDSGSPKGGEYQGDDSLDYEREYEPFMEPADNNQNDQTNPR